MLGSAATRALLPNASNTFDSATNFGLPTQCLCGLSASTKIRKWTLVLNHLLAGKQSSVSLADSHRMALRSLSTALQQHLTLCFQLNEEDDTGLVQDLLLKSTEPVPQSHATELPAIPISVQLRVPEALVHNYQMSYEIQNPELHPDDGVWNSDLKLYFVPPVKPQLPGREVEMRKVDKSVQVFKEMLLKDDLSFLSESECMTSPRESMISIMGRRRNTPAMDLRRKTEDKIVWPLNAIDKDPLADEEQQWKDLEKLEIEAFEDLKSPLKRKTSFYNYTKILMNELEKYKQELDKWSRISSNHFQLVKKSLTKEMLHEVVQYRLLREDIKQEIDFLENQIQHRVVVIEKDVDSGSQKRMPVVDPTTTRERFAKSTRTIAKMIELLKEQVNDQIKSVPVDVIESAKAQATSKVVEDFEHFV